MFFVLRSFKINNYTHFFRKIITINTRFKRQEETFLNPGNGLFLEETYNSWLRDPQSVEKSWDNYFRSSDCSSGQKPLDIDATIRAYQARGHLIADIDPLGIQNPEVSKLQGTPDPAPAVVVRKHLEGVTEADFKRKYALPNSLTVIGGSEKSLSLREILTRLNKIYCGHLGLEYTYIPDFEVLDWLRHKFEIPGAWELRGDHRKYIWQNVMRAVTFESFLAKKYGAEKRFGLEGCESFVPAIVQCFETSAEHGVEAAVIGMAHRGRLNTLVNICSKPMYQLFVQFNPIPMEGMGSGDVKYHLGTHSERLLERCGKKIRIAVLGNPSHLEAVSPLVVGRVRAEQVVHQDFKGKKSMAVLVHGDAAFAGQGICYETMHLTNLPDYTTGGVIHAVINNQIGFTTDPRYSRSSTHCTDVARVVNAPIFHVHADDPDLVAYCSKVAAEYRATYHNDVVLDIVGYRRNGHNEMYEPMLTQPLMYKRIKSHPNVLKIYSDKLLKEGIIDEDFIKQETNEYLDHCESEFKKAQTISTMQMSDWHDVPWSEFFANQNPMKKIPHTGISLSDIKKITTAFSTSPGDIEAHAQVFRVMERREKLISEGRFDWAMGEALAIVSLLKDGYHVRLSGQDVECGTFSHRIHIIHDQNRDMTWKNILHNIYPKQALYTVTNSPLSEFGMLGFELGYSAYDHNTLTLWEAQFGDFANNCQVVIDSLLCSGQSKWGRQVGLVLLLPHGMEGQGPEHSSARLERFLQLCDDSTHVSCEEDLDAPRDESPDCVMTRQLFEVNWIVCNITTPANLVHVLRRQILMPFRKPLIIMTPKSLLRHPDAQSSFTEIEPGTSLKPIYEDLSPPIIASPEAVRKVIICSGKVYYDLVPARRERKLDELIAIVRIEQICPFPYHWLAKEISRFPIAKITWVQEEHQNQGAYYYVRDRIALALGLPIEEIRYCGRPASAAPATGCKMIHQEEILAFIDAAMTIE